MLLLERPGIKDWPNCQALKGTNALIIPIEPGLKMKRYKLVKMVKVFRSATRFF